MSGQRTVSVQEAVHMIDGQELVLCSDHITHVSLQQGATMKKKDDKDSIDIVSRYRNRPDKYYAMTLDTYFYSVFCREVLHDVGNNADRTKHRMLIAKGMKCKPVYPVNYDYARGMLIMHKPWSKEKPLYELLKNRKKTVRTFQRMVDNQQLPSSVIAQYICAMKYKHQKKLEIISKDGTSQTIDISKLSERQKEEYIAHQHLSHFSDNKPHKRVLDGMVVDIGEKLDWTQMRFNGERDIAIDGEKWMGCTRERYYKIASDQATAEDDIILPRQKNGELYSVDKSEQQREIVYRAVETIVKFLNNDPTYKPMRATIMGCGGTGKSFIINTIISMVRKLTSCNDTVQVAAPSGAAAFNVQGSTIHRLLSVSVKNPEQELPDKTRDRLKKQLQRLLVLIVDERSMISSKVLAAAERNTRQCIYNGQNSTEVWGGLPVVLLFGDDYQLMPIAEEGAIQGFHKKQEGVGKHVTNKMTSSQLLAYGGQVLFTEGMTESVYCLTKNYRVACKQFKDLLGRVRIGKPSNDDAKKIMNLHMHHYRADKDFVNLVENGEKTMWLFTNNADKDAKNAEKLVETSKRLKVPVARLDCWYDTNRLQNGSERCGVKSHFDPRSYVDHTDICVGARVAINKVNFLPEVGLYNGSIGTVKEIVYRTSVVGPNDKQHCHLPDYVVVDFPNLNLPPHIRPWDLNNKTVSSPRLHKSNL